jgi:hypothetical protein
MRGVNTSEWQETKEIEMKSMNTNEVWETEVVPNGAKTVGCKRVYKTKYDSKGNIRYKAWLESKNFTQREWIDYNKC